MPNAQTRGTPALRRSLSNRLGDVIIAACNGGFAAVDRWHVYRGRQPVDLVTTDQLVENYLGNPNSPWLLVDVRSEHEQAVSRIPGAITQREFEADPQHYAGKTIVPYCTAGGRSYLYTRQLIERGVPAKNYRDSILGWVRAGLPLETPDGQPSRRIHPYWRLFDVPSDYDVHL